MFTILAIIIVIVLSLIFLDITFILMAFLGGWTIVPFIIGVIVIATVLKALFGRNNE